MELNNRKNEVKAEAKMSSIAIEVRHTVSYNITEAYFRTNLERAALSPL